MKLLILKAMMQQCVFFLLSLLTSISSGYLTIFLLFVCSWLRIFHGIVQILVLWSVIRSLNERLQDNRITLPPAGVRPDSKQL